MPDPDRAPVPPVEVRVDQVVHHGTTAEAAASILAGGFRAGVTDYGPGVVATVDVAAAAGWAAVASTRTGPEGPDTARTAVVVDARVRLDRALAVNGFDRPTGGRDLLDVLCRAAGCDPDRIGAGSDTVGDALIPVVDALARAGIDGLVLVDVGIVAVFDPARLTPTGMVHRWAPADAARYAIAAGRFDNV